MNEREKTGCHSILQKLDTEDLMSLKDTVTKRQIAVESRNEATKAILTFSQSSLELLKRKKIKRELIFQYLADESVPVAVSAEKHQLIQKCLEFWGSDINSNNMNELEDEQTNSASAKSSSSSQTETLTRVSCGTQPTQTGTCLMVQEPNQNDRDHLQLCPDSEVNGLHRTSDSVQTSQQTTIDKTNSELQTLGETFARWFYKMLNSHNPAMNQTPEEFGPNHFWNDVKLQLICVTPQPSSDSFDGCVLVSQRLLALVKEEQLLFNPNISYDGIHAKSDPHGLLVVLVCGTIHRHSDCLGVFQQMFGLVRDPRFENNWKVKTTKLRIKSEQVTTVPRLEDADNSELLALGGSGNAVVTYS